MIFAEFDRLRDLAMFFFMGILMAVSRCSITRLSGRPLVSLPNTKKELSL
jgi:hypothetical protein